MKHIILKSSVILFTVCLSLFVFTYGTATAESPQPSIEERYDLAMNIWLNKLAFCESGDKKHPNGNPNAVNPKDSDGKPAYGLMQYKLGTFMGFAKEFKIYPELTIDMVHKYAMDGEKSYYLTKEVIKQDPKKADQWGCRFHKEVGKPPKIEDFT
jgi:hypothetical protein